MTRARASRIKGQRFCLSDLASALNTSLHLQIFPISRSTPAPRQPSTGSQTVASCHSYSRIQATRQHRLYLLIKWQASLIPTPKTNLPSLPSLRPCMALAPPEPLDHLADRTLEAAATAVTRSDSDSNRPSRPAHDPVRVFGSLGQTQIRTPVLGMAERGMMRLCAVPLLLKVLAAAPAMALAQAEGEVERIV